MVICSIECWCEDEEAAEGDVVVCGMYIKSVQAGGVAGLWGYASYNLIAFSPEINQHFWDVPEGEKRLVGLSNFTMLNKDVKVLFTGLYWGADDKWHEYTTKAITVKFKAGTGSISATSTPSGAKVYLEGVYIGISPLTISNVPIGQRWVKFIKAGYVDKVVSVIVEAGKTVTAHADLEPPAPEKCDQDFRVTDKDGNPLDAYVKIGSLVSRTYSDGECTIIGLTKGDSYTAEASKSGYICLDCTKTFTACTSKITLKLTTEVPEKKDTEIDDFDVKDIEGVPVRKLYVDHTYQWKAFLYEYKLVGHGDPIKGRKIEIKRVDTGALLFAGNTQTNGGIVGSWTAEDKHKGAYKVQAKFAGDSAYNSSESGKFDIEVIGAPKRGVEVVVKNVPSEGLKVLIAPYGKLIPYVCAWSMKTEKTIYSDLESVMFDLTTTIYIGITKACIQVKNMADELMDELKAESIPTTGTATKHLNGYHGCPYRTWLGASPRTPAPGKSFTLTAHLIKNPKETVGKDFEVVFYEVVDEVEERIGANLTNEMGQAMFMTSKTEPGTYTYVARYSGGDTFAEPTTVTVSAVPPCPIEEAFREVCPMTMAFGCVITPDLVTLRAFRDAVLPRIVVKAYYAAGPFIILLFVNNRASKWFIRKLVHIVAQRLRKRWSY